MSGRDNGVTAENAKGTEKFFSNSVFFAFSVVKFLYFSR